MLAGVNFIVTILNMRAPGMTLMRMPVFVWMSLVVQFLVVLALMLLLGQGVIYLLAGHNRARHLAYQIFQIITRPVIRATRRITPRVVIDRHVPFVAFLLLSWIFLVLGLWVLPDLACKLGRIECPGSSQPK
jgi:hypothetical protein